MLVQMKDAYPADSKPIYFIRGIDTWEDGFQGSTLTPCSSKQKRLTCAHVLRYMAIVPSFVKFIR